MHRHQKNYEISFFIAVIRGMSQYQYVSQWEVHCLLLYVY